MTDEYQYEIDRLNRKIAKLTDDYDDLDEAYEALESKHKSLTEQYASEISTYQNATDTQAQALQDAQQQNANLQNALRMIANGDVRNPAEFARGMLRKLII